MAQMSMNKVIHRAVRRDLTRFSEALSGFRDADRNRAAALHRAWENFDQQLTHHHEGEHEIAWPGLLAIGVDDALLTQFNDEHDRMAEALAGARSAMDRLAASATRADADTARAALNRLQEATVTHLDHEEQETEQVYLDNVDSPAMKEMSKKFGRSLSLGAAGVYLAWLQDGATAEETAALKSGIPGPVIAVMTTIFGRRYRNEIAPVWSSQPR
jgi:hemerythrin-like domain-containing protein